MLATSRGDGSPAVSGRRRARRVERRSVSDFATALRSGHLPTVSFVKPPNYADGHAGYSDPLDEQRFLVPAINDVQQSRDWRSTAIIVAWDDSEGWYDHQMPPIINSSHDRRTAR